MSRSDRRLALVVEMNVLLMPASFAIASLYAAVLTLGVSRSAHLVWSYYDLPAYARTLAVVLTFFPLYAAWTLGVMTVRRERYAFDAGFWLALACSGASAHLTALFASPLAVLAMLPVWIFTAHMALLQMRLRKEPAPPMESAAAIADQIQ